MVRVNREEWQPVHESTWDWPLHIGKNSIEVRARNVQGVMGPVSHAEVIYNP